MRAGIAVLGLVAALAGCGGDEPAAPVTRHAGATPEMMALVERYADYHDIPPELLHRVIDRESDYNPAARNGPYLGLMQILPATAASRPSSSTSSPSSNGASATAATCSASGCGTEPGRAAAAA